MKTKTAQLRLAFSLFCIGLLPGCGGGSSGTGSYASGIDTTRTINTLDQKDINGICQRYEDYAKKLISSDQFCTLAGILFSNLDQSVPPNERIAQCEELKNQCVDSSKNPDPEDTEPSCPVALSAALQECGGTVGELDLCLNDEFIALDSFFNSLSCNVAADPNSIKAPQVSDIQSCAALEKKCPKLFQNKNED